MTRLHIAPNTELLIAERSLGAPALVLGLAAGLNLFFWLKARYGVRSWPGRIGLCAASLAAGFVVVGGLIAVAGAVTPLFGWACAALALVGVVAASYLWGTRHAGAGAVILLALRLLAIATLALLYFEPTLKFVKRNVRRSRLLVMIDTSGSMKINDGPGKLSRLDWVRSELLGRSGALAKLDDDFELELYSFADTVKPVDSAQLSELKPEGRSTTFAPTVGEICAKSDKLTTTGALVLSDGIDNSGHDPVNKIAEAGLPVFPIAVGSKLREKGDFKDIAVTRVDYEREIAADNKTEMTAHIEAVGLKGRRISVVFRFGGKEEDNQALTLDDFPGTQSVKLSFTPTKPKDDKPVQCSVEVTEDPDERITDNNKKEFTVIVTEPDIKVLLVEGVVRAEYKWLVRTLQMDPNVSLVALVQVRRGTFNQQGNVKDIKLTGFPTDYETLKKFNVVVFGDIDRSFFTTSQLRNIQNLVESGGRGFLMMGGYSALGPGGYAGTPIEDILPVRLGGKEIGQEKDPFLPKLTADGATHPIFSGIGPFFVTDDRGAARPLPPLLGCTRVGSLKPGATLLAVHPRRTGHDGKPLPLAAVQRSGTGRAMVFTADTTWRWYLGLRGLGRDTPYIRFWGQALRWLAGQDPKKGEEKPGITAYTGRVYYEPGSTVRIYARVRDQQGQATNQADVTAMISGPAGSPSSRQIPYIPGSTGKYEVDFSPPSPGEYKMLVKAETLQGPIGTAELEFRVGRPNLEFDKLDLDDKMLKRLAQKTKGRYVTLVGLNNFVGRLKSVEQAKSTITSVDVWSDKSFSIFGQEISLYLLLAFLAFSALVTAEWVIRKRRQLL